MGGRGAANLDALEGQADHELTREPKLMRWSLNLFSFEAKTKQTRKRKKFVLKDASPRVSGWSVN